jgi:hypothetical protein
MQQLDSPLRSRRKPLPFGANVADDVTAPPQLRPARTVMDDSQYRTQWTHEINRVANAIVPSKGKGRRIRPSGALNEDNYDMAIVMKKVVPDNAKGTKGGIPRQEEEIDCSAVLARLRTARLKTKKIHSLLGNKLIIKVKAPEKRLEEAADRMGFMLMASDGSWKRFKRIRRDAFPEQLGGGLFCSRQRQEIVDWIIQGRERDGGADINAGSTKNVQQMFPLHKVARRTYCCCSRQYARSARGPPSRAAL